MCICMQIKALLRSKQPFFAHFWDHFYPYYYIGKLCTSEISDIPTFTVSDVTFDSELSAQKVIPFWKAKILGYKMGVI